jgi:CRISPR/Cas system-associated exonuclease Cas4 (RecB family)
MQNALMAYRELVNEFSWSKSRHGKFEECRRLYWFTYYGSWGGWKENAPREAREAYILKNLSSRQQWAGKVVHDAIRDALALARDGAAPTLEVLVRQARDRMREDFRRSRRGDYRDAPKKVVGLIEHELETPIADEEWKANWQNAEACLAGFHGSSWLSKARGLSRERWLPIDEIDSFLLDGVKVFAGPDFAFREGDGAVLVDWKTGRPRDEDREQLQGYALYAAEKWRVRPEAVIARLVYLGKGEDVDVPVDAAALDGFRAFFRKSVSRMKERLVDAGKNLARKEDFPMAEDLLRCRDCAFRRECGRQAGA